MNKVHFCGVLFVLSTFTTLGVAQKEICVGAIAGGDTVTWNIQQPLLKAITTEAASRGDAAKTQLLMSNNDKSAKSEMASIKCDYALMTNVRREWPTPKGGGLKTEDGKADEKNPHPSSTAWFQFTLLGKGGKKIDKFETSIEMPVGATAKDVAPQLQDLIQQMANWTLDGTIETK